MIKTETIFVTYWFKNKDGYLTETRKLFHTSKAAYEFIRYLNNTIKTFGSPMIDTRK